MISQICILPPNFSVASPRRISVKSPTSSWTSDTSRLISKFFHTAAANGPTGTYVSLEPRLCWTMVALLSICTPGFLVSTTLGYNLLRDYSGSTFFDGWDFYGAPDNLTTGTTDCLPRLKLMLFSSGNVSWVTAEVAMSERLAYVNDQGHVILKVDNTTNVRVGENRNAVGFQSLVLLQLHRPSSQIRITTRDAYELGSLWLIDGYHIPFGCSVSPRSLAR